MPILKRESLVGTVNRHCLGHSPDCIVVNGSDICHKDFHIDLGLSLRLIPHEPMLLIAGDDIDDDAIGFTDSSLQGIGTLHHEHAPSTDYSVCLHEWAEAIAMQPSCSCRQALTGMTTNNEAWLVCCLQQPYSINCTVLSA